MGEVFQRFGIVGKPLPCQKSMSHRNGVYNKCFLVSKRINLDAFIAARTGGKVGWKVWKLIKNSGNRFKNAKSTVVYTFTVLNSAFEHME